MSEMAVVSSRKARLQSLADEGDESAVRALALIEHPNRFLSTVQIGITLIGVLAGAFGGTAVSGPIADQLVQTFPDLEPATASTIAVGLIVGLTTYLSLVIGELVPKRIALSSPEAVARLIAGPMTLLSKLATPVVWLLSTSTSVVVRFLPIKPDDSPDVTEMEVLSMIRQGVDVGIFAKDEEEMVEGVMRLDEIRVGSVITPRTEVVYLDIEDDAETIQERIASNPYTTYPVVQNNMDRVLGIVRVKDLLSSLLKDQTLDLEAIMLQPLLIPESVTVAHALEQFKSTGIHTGLVVGEYGGIEGLVRMHDIIEQIFGELDEGEYANHDPDTIQRGDGSWLLAGQVSLDKLADIYPEFDIPDNERGNYETLAGFVMSRLGRVPSVTDTFEWQDLVFEVVDMDDVRIDRVLVYYKKQES